MHSLLATLVIQTVSCRVLAQALMHNAFWIFEDEFAILEMCAEQNGNLFTGRLSKNVNEFGVTAATKDQTKV